MNIVRPRATGHLLCRRPDRPTARAVVSRATVVDASQAPPGNRRGTANDTNSPSEADLKRAARRRAARRRAAARRRKPSQQPNQANTVQQLCTSTSDYLKQSDEKAVVNLNGRTLALGQQSAVQLSHDERPTATCFRSPHLQIWPRITHAIDEYRLLERAGKGEAFMDECLFSLQADSSAVVHRLSAADISNGTVQLADDHCLFLDDTFFRSFENVTFRGGALVLCGAKCTFEHCRFEYCTLVATEGPNPARVHLNNVEFDCSVLEGAGIGIYASGSIVTADDCHIVGGWQGVAAHNGSSFSLIGFVCENARLIGIECYASIMRLNGASCHCPVFKAVLSQANSFEQVILPELMAERYNVRFPNLSEPVDPQSVGGMLFGSLLVHEQATLEMCDSCVSGYRGALVRKYNASIAYSGIDGFREALIVSHGGRCQLEDCSVSHDFAGHYISDLIGACTTVRVSGHDSSLSEDDSFKSSDSVLVEKGARAHLRNESLPDSSSEGEEHSASSAGEEKSVKEVVVVSRGQEALYWWK